MARTKNANQQNATMVADTIPKLLISAVDKYGSAKVAMRRKDLGIWQEYTWQDSYEMVKFFSLALLSLGMEHGDKVSIIGDNDPEWFWAAWAAQAAGGVSVGIYIDCMPSEVKYIVEHSDSKFIVARDQEQVDKVLEIKDDLPNLKKVIYWDKKGMWKYEDPILTSFDEMITLGRQYEQDHPGAFEENVSQGKAEDMAVLCYTSGTTALPKGVILSHHNLIWIMQGVLKIDPWHETDDYLSYLSPAWITEQGNGLVAPLLAGTRVNFPEEPETVANDIREVAPQCLLYSSRQWEGLVSEIQVRVSNASILKRSIYQLFLTVGYKVADVYYKWEKPSLFWRILYALGNILVFRPLRDKHGLIRATRATAGGTYVGPDVFRYLAAIGVRIRNGYGLSEAGWSTGPLRGKLKLDSVGVPVPGVEVRISAQGEILIRSPHVFLGYYKDAEATARRLEGGWCHSGDAGSVDEDGHVHFIERMDDLMKLSGGGQFSPTYIEGRLKFSPYVRDMMVIGDEIKPFVTAIVAIDFETVGKWAEKRHIPYTTFADLSQKREVYDLVENEIARVNAYIPSEGRIRKFVNLYKEFDPDEAELTRTRKIRRKFLENRYKTLIEAMYQDKAEVVVEIEVKYRDGRKGAINAPIKIHSLREAE